MAARVRAKMTFVKDFTSGKCCNASRQTLRVAWMLRRNRYDIRQFAFALSGSKTRAFL